jgi:molybdopterin synthase catalytic subunit/molybdopterin synthase sulfur carrier subunit
VKVRVRLFAVARELAGAESLDLDLPEGATVAQLRAALVRHTPELARVLPHVLFAVGNEYVRDNTVISPDSEVACIPPVSGG